MRWREPVLLGVIAALAYLLIQMLPESYQEALAVLIFVPIAFMVHNGWRNNGG